MPRLLIGDANILIDMECGGLLDRMFAVDYEFAVLDVLFEEELAAVHPDPPLFPAQGPLYQAVLQLCNHSLL